MNAKLRAQVATSRPRVAEVRKTLAPVERQIGNYTRAIARGDFASLESALGAAEQRRTTLQTGMGVVSHDSWLRKKSLLMVRRRKRQVVMGGNVPCSIHDLLLLAFHLWPDRTLCR